MASSIIALVGPAAAGKSTLAEALYGLTGLEWVGPDDVRGYTREQTWQRLREMVDAHRDGCIIESVIVPPGYRLMLQQTPSLIVAVTASRTVRRERLAQRTAWSTMRRRHALDHSTRPYQHASILIDTTHGLGSQATLLAAHVRCMMRARDA